MSRRGSLQQSRHQSKHFRSSTYQEHRLQNRKQAKAFIRELKAHSVCSCGESHPGVLQFHHRDPQKKRADIYMMAAQGWSLERIKNEIAKCDVLCANCHAKWHWEERQRHNHHPQTLRRAA